MKNIFSAILTFLGMISCLLPVFLFMVSCGGVIVSAFYLVLLIIHLISKKDSTKFIDPVDSNPIKAQKIKRWLYILIPIFLFLMCLFSFLNSWYQEGHFFDLMNAAFLFLIILFEVSIVFSVKKWNTLRLSGFIPVILGIIFVYLAFTTWGTFIRQDNLINQKIVDLRFNHDFSKYTQLIKQIESKNFKDWEEIPVPDYFPAVRIYAWKTDTEVLIVKFYTGGWGFAGDTHHWGYFYFADDDYHHMDYSSDMRIRKIQPCWYRYSD